MKGSIALFRQALGKCAEAHKANYHDNVEDNFAIIMDDTVPLLADLRSICKAIFGTPDMVNENGGIGGLSINYGGTAPLEEADEMTLRLALPNGTVLIDDEASYNELLQKQTEENVETINKAMKRIMESGHATEANRTALYWLRNTTFEALVETIRQKGAPLFLSWNQETHKRIETQEGTEGSYRLGTEIDLHAVPEELRTILVPTEKTKQQYYGRFSSIKTLEMEKAVLDKVAEVEGGPLGVTDYNETVIRLSFTHRDSTKEEEFFNNYGVGRVDMTEHLRIFDIIEYNEYLNNNSGKEQEPPSGDNEEILPF